MAAWRLAATPEDAGAAGAELGGRVALKRGRGQGSSVEMAARIAAQGTKVEEFFAQGMVPSGGVEMLVGVVHDMLVGPVVACAAGGTAVEVMQDVKVRITPLTDSDTHVADTSLRTFPLLDGFRAAPKRYMAGLEELLLRVAAMGEQHPEIAEMDANPVIVRPEGAVIVDARIRIEAARSNAPPATEPASSPPETQAASLEAACAAVPASNAIDQPATVHPATPAVDGPNESPGARARLHDEL
ncbi:MAG: acetate--CoA ligase family protein [Candidatus Limnocylindrales bacterium]|jgi:hypothetical protein